MENQGSVNPTSTTDYDDMGDLVYDDDDDDGGGGEKSTENITTENQESSANTEVENPVTVEDNDTEDTEDQTDNIQSSDIYKVQPRRNRSLKSLALSILKYLPEDILREEPDFSSIKSNDTIQDCEACQECDKPILTEDPPRSLVLNVCGDVIHRTCANNPVKRGVLECSCGVADDKDPSLSSEGEMDVDEDNEKSTRREETSSNSKGKKRANEATDSSSSKKAKQTTDEDSRVLKNLIRELSIDTLKVSEVREKEGIFRLQQEVGNSSIFLTLYSKITNAEERHENSNQDVIQAYLFGEALNRRLEHHKKTKEDHEARDSVNDEVRKQLPKEVTKNAIRKRTGKARKIYDLFRRIGADKIQRVRSFSASRIAKLSDVKVDYIVKEVIALL